MWFGILFFGGIIVYLVWGANYNINKSNQKETEELNETKQEIKDEYNELNNLIEQLEEVNNVEKNSEADISSYYDDTVPDEEIKQVTKNIKDDELTTNEVIFLKFMNNKSLDISFSPRWEFQYELKPRIELAKLLKLKYLTQSSWYDNVKNATAKELKEILKAEELKVTGNKQELIERVLGNIDVELLERTFNKDKYMLTDKGKQIIAKNKRLFMSDRERAGSEFVELTDGEYSQLQVFRKVNEYKQLKHNELSFEKGYKKNDILWSIYNTQTLEYLNKKDYVMASVVYNNMYSLLYSEKRYEKALDFLICCLYMRVYEILPNDGIIYDTDCYKRHLKKYMKDLRNTLKKNNIDIEIFDNRNKFISEDVKVSIQTYLPHWCEFEKVNKFQQKINEALDA